MYTERDIKEKFSKIANIYSIIALVGARQAGKTTFLKEQIKHLNSSYVSFDDPDVRLLFEKDIKKFEKQYLEGKEISVLDEVHYCKDAGRKLKYLADNNRKLWITSSSEIILSKKVLSYLVGRVSIIKLYPFSVSEFLNAKMQKEVTPEILERDVWEHITFGGYPKVLSIGDVELKKIILQDIYETMILKDVAKTFSIEDLTSLELFTKYLSFNIGGLISYESISRDIGISFHTIKKYLNAMEKSHLIVKTVPFHTNKIKEIIKQPKIYFIDTGLRNIVAKQFTEPDGKIFENYVLSELLKLGFAPKFWRTKSKTEVDFIIEKNNEIIPIEVKVNSEHKIEKSLRSFIETYKPKKAIIVSYKEISGKKTVKGCKISFVNILEMRKILLS